MICVVTSRLNIDYKEDMLHESKENFFGKSFMLI